MAEIVKHARLSVELHRNEMPSMGYDLPAAIGMAFTRPESRTVCLTGDGSLMMNLQKLQTVAYHRLKLKIFIFNNGGYLSIRSTQQAFFQRLLGEGTDLGCFLPGFRGAGRRLRSPGVPAGKSRV